MRAYLDCSSEASGHAAVPQPELFRGLVALLADAPHGVTPLEVGRTVLRLTGPARLVSKAGHGLLLRLGARRAGSSPRFRLTAEPRAEHSSATPEEPDAPRLADPSDEPQRRRLAGACVSVEQQAILDALPDRPGVYRLIAHGGEVIYVGKAKSLQRRVASYFAPSMDDRRLASELRRETASVEVVETGSEVGALLEELRLIRALRPRFNVQVEVRRRRPPAGRFVLFLPGGTDTAVELLGLRDGLVVGRALTRRPRGPMRPVWTLLRRCLSAEAARRPACEEDRIVATWLRRERHRCNVLELDRTGGLQDAARLVRAYLRDPCLFSAKLFVR